MVQRRRARTTFLGGLFASFIGFVILIAVAEIGLRIVMPHWSEFDNSRFMTPITVPGYGRVYVGTPGFDGYFSQNNGDFRAHIVINAFGMRDTEPPEAADGRIWFLGDSMTFGWGVEREEDFGAVAARAAGAKMYLVASPGANVCGYEALLARMPKTAQPRAVVLGLILENDLEIYSCPRGTATTTPEQTQNDSGGLSLLEIKYWLTGRSAIYDVVAVSLKRVPAVLSILQRLGLVAREHAYRLNYPPDEYRAIIPSTADEIAHLRTMLPGGTPFVVLVVPGRFEIRDGDPVFTGIRTAMLDELAKRGIATIDPTPALKAAGFAAVHFSHDGHWSPRGHEIAGNLIASWLKTALPTP